MSKWHREMLQVSLRGEFSSFARERGHRLFHSSAVHFASGNQWQVSATVVDRGNNKVTISRSNDQLDMSCSCATAQARFLCPHFWAVILACDQRSFLLGRFDSGNAALAPGWKRTSEPEPDDDFLDDEDDNYEFERKASAALSKLRPTAGRRKHPTAPKPPAWQTQINQIKAYGVHRARPANESWPATREVYYVIDLTSTRTSMDLTLQVAYRDIKQNGEWGKLKTQRIPRALLTQVPDPADRELLFMLGGAPDPMDSYDSIASTYRLRFGQHEELFRRMSPTGRFRLRRSEFDEFEQLLPMVWDDGPQWRFELFVEPDGDEWAMNGRYRRGEDTLELKDAILVHEVGVLATANSFARFEQEGAVRWIALLASSGPIRAPRKHGSQLVQEIMGLPVLPQIVWPEELRYEEFSAAPRNILNISERRTYYSETTKLDAKLIFDYGGTPVAWDDPRSGFYEADKNRYIRRDTQAELAASETLASLRLKQSPYYYSDGRSWEISNKRLPAIARELISKGWHIEAQGKAFRNASSVNVSLSSGIDWFELHGEVDFGTVKVKLPALLKAIRKGEDMIPLEDGSIGFLPQEILDQYGMLFGMGSTHEDHVRFSRAQAGLLDVLLAQRPEIPVDQAFQQARQALRRFDGIQPAEQPEGFTGGELRSYQREGVAWMSFLREFGWGGCLADDMGVGKTAQVLALLESRRAARLADPEAKIPPSLVVVPRSLVYNWKQEAARFTPQLRMIDHTGVERDRTLASFENGDVILTTYGTMRRDVIDYQNFRFDYIVLDEAQAIKNAASESAKAARLLTGNHRLALSGTPIENHLGELWSLFEFLNPGMLGGAQIFQGASGALRNPDEATRIVLSRALRPFILRRTKSQVAPELPEKLEQTIQCELDATQRKLYNELRDHYRMSLLGRVDRDGIAKAKMHILEALLRLRQAACHPGLIDKKRVHESSAKLDTLFARLDEVVAENHKSLVFSQFTSLLAIVRNQLDKQGIPYAYLDGQTADRQAAVEQFQTDKNCKLFLISLKAGGLGLNLTAAEYVFLLDPWWNPAVESQAIDRAHRIGQQNSVFAYRLIAKDTVEEKVLLLQESKRNLADAIITADNRLIGSLGREDLELLLS